LERWIATKSERNSMVIEYLPFYLQTLAD
jgi:hypothetical protein